LAQGKSPNQGVLVDYLMDFHESARAGLPVYSLSGGAAGYVWVARFDKKGRGNCGSVFMGFGFAEWLNMAKPPANFRYTWEAFEPNVAPVNLDSIEWPPK
jgi:hypothetical protein